MMNSVSELSDPLFASQVCLALYLSRPNRAETQMRVEVARAIAHVSLEYVLLAKPRWRRLCGALRMPAIVTIAVEVLTSSDECQKLQPANLPR